jgi:hypothetical protein
VTTEVSVPNKLHGRLLASNRRLIRDVEYEFNGVRILFSEEKGANNVAIRGPKNDVEKAKVALKELVKHCEQTTEDVTISTEPEYITFLIAHDGAKMRKLREKFPSVRITFLTESEPCSRIMLIGKKEEVDAVKKIYLRRRPLLPADSLYDMVRFFDLNTLIRLVAENLALNRATQHALRLLRVPRVVRSLEVLHLLDTNFFYFDDKQKIK